MSDDIYVLIEHLRGEVAEISYVMLAAGRSIAESTGGGLAAVLLGHEVEGLAQDLGADRVIHVEDKSLSDFVPDRYQAVMESLISEGAPRLVLLGHTTIGMDVASQLSAKLDAPLISQVLHLRLEGEKLAFEAQICGGKMLAEGEVPGPTALVTMLPSGYKAEAGKAAAPPPVERVAPPAFEPPRMRLRTYIEPEVEDIDITREAVLVSVGRGIEREDNIDLAQALADHLGGALCASRPIVDQGWLPSTRMVGKSGKTVKSRIYLALGISGAPEHVEGLRGCETIIAVNTDPNAPIFDIADYGAAVDLFDLVPPLTAKIEQAKGG